MAQALARQQAADLVQGLTKTKKQALRSVIARGIDQGWSDTVLRRRIADVVGLDERFARAVEAHRQGLLAQGIPPGRAQQSAQRYAKRLLLLRAQNIAQYETQSALLTAQRLLWTQMQDDGDISRYAVRVWTVHQDERRCRICRPMNGRRASVRAGTGYQVPGVGHVAGPPVHPRCRCYEVLKDEGVVKAMEYRDLWGDAPTLSA